MYVTPSSAALYEKLVELSPATPRNRTRLLHLLLADEFFLETVSVFVEL